MRYTVAELDESNLRHNISQIKKFAPNSSIVAMVKANAYGHGIEHCAKILREEGVEYLGFAFVDEAIEVRQMGDNGKMIVLVSAQEDEIDKYLDYNIETTFSSFDIARLFAERAKVRNHTVFAHLFVDTGMHRDGVAPGEALKFIEKVEKLGNIQIIGICSHLSTADSDDLGFAWEQMELFNRTVEHIESKGYKFKYKHLSNSAGLVNIPCKACNLVRPGISLYGLMSTQELAQKMGLKPVLSLKSRVQLIKPVKKGETVGYSLKYIAEKDTNVAVVPIGYGDGLLRNLSNKMQCLINGKRYNQIGTICMDECMFDIGNDDIRQLDEVVLIGKQGSEEITVYEIAEIAGTISYEVTTLITKRVPRIIKK
jgi:alanine racemase